MTLIFLLQLTLPLFFIGWIALAPMKSALAFYLQILGTTFGLLALALTGLWLFPPWWTPYALAGLLGVAAYVGWRRRYPFASRTPSGWLAWIYMIPFVPLGGWGVDQSVRGLAGREPHGGPTIDLAFPLRGGAYLVVNGGSNVSVNAHVMTLDSSVARFHAYRGQSYGVDLVKTDAWGLRANGLQPVKPGAYDIYGEPVYAPCSGIVMIAIDGVPDMMVPQVDRAHMAGNHVLLRCKDADVLLGHFKPGSVRVAAGNDIAAGDRIASVGNTGNTGEPHLHIHAQRRGSVSEPFSGDPLPIRLDGRFLVRNDRVSTR